MLKMEGLLDKGLVSFGPSDDNRGWDETHPTLVHMLRQDGHRELARKLDNMKKEPEENWHIVRGALPVYYLFPNIILLVFDFGMILLREYPVDDSPNKSVSKISFYVWPGVLETVSIEDIRSEIGVGFADVIKEEDYVAAADSHKSLMSGAIDFLTFGRNEPMLHHYHNTYREALGLVPLEKLNSLKS